MPSSLAPCAHSCGKRPGRPSVTNATVKDAGVVSDKASRLPVRSAWTHIIRRPAKMGFTANPAGLPIPRAVTYTPRTTRDLDLIFKVCVYRDSWKQITSRVKASRFQRTRKPRWRMSSRRSLSDSTSSQRISSLEFRRASWLRILTGTSPALLSSSQIQRGSSARILCAPLPASPQ